MTQHRLINWIILLSLPIIVLLGWFVTERAPTWLSNVPVWLRPTSPDPVLGACEAVAAVNAYAGQYVNFAQPTTLSAAQALERARQHVMSTIEGAVEGEPELSRPTLVRGTFSEAGERLAWLVIATLPREPDARFDRVAVAFVDAENGDLNALVVANSVVDAGSACATGPIGRRALVRQYLPVLLAAAYTGFVVVGVTLRRWWQRWRRGRKAL